VLQDSPRPFPWAPPSGHAAYGSAVDLNETAVGATYFMTYHTILKDSSDYIDALKMARVLADNITQSLGHRVFPYRLESIFQFNTSKGKSKNVTLRLKFTH